jgi:capsid protein
MKKKQSNQVDMAIKGAEIKARLISAVNEFKAYTNSNMAPNSMRSRTHSTPNVQEREYSRFTREQACAKARQFVDESPIVAGLVMGMTDSVVGGGFQLSMQSGDRVWDKECLAWHMERRDKLDIRGIRTWGQLNRSWYTRRFVDGDVGIYKRTIPGVGKEPEKRYLATIESERIRWQKWNWLDTGTPGSWKTSDKATGIKIQQGIAYDNDGRMHGAFIGPRPENQMDWAAILKEGQFVSADQFILYMHMLSDRIDPLRGITALMPNFNLFQDIAQILENVIQKIQNESFIALAFYMEQSMVGGVMGDVVKDAGNGAKRRHVPMKPGMNLSLSPGEKVDLLGMKSPNSELMPFLRFCMRIAGTPYGFPLEMLLLDVSETNFSGGRLLLELAKRRQKVEQDSLAKVCSDVFLWDLNGAIRAGELKVPSSLKDGKFGRHRWGKPSLPYYDPGREAQANGMNMDRLLIAPQDIISENGEQDHEDILDKWQEWKADCEARGLPVIFGQTSTQIQDQGNDVQPIKKGSK